MFSKSLPPISYGLSRKVDTWWLAPSLYGLSVVVIAVLVVVNVGLTTYDAIITTTDSFNATQTLWYHRFTGGPPKPGSQCSPYNLTVGQPFTTTTNLLTYNLLTIEGDKRIFPYAGVPLQACDVISTVVDVDTTATTITNIAYVACNTSGLQITAKTEYVWSALASFEDIGRPSPGSTFFGAPNDGPQNFVAFALNAVSANLRALLQASPTRGPTGTPQRITVQSLPSCSKHPMYQESYTSIYCNPDDTIPVTWLYGGGLEKYFGFGNGSEFPLQYEDAIQSTGPGWVNLGFPYDSPGTNITKTYLPAITNVLQVLISAVRLDVGRILPNNPFLNMTTMNQTLENPYPVNIEVAGPGNWPATIRQLRDPANVAGFGMERFFSGNSTYINGEYQCRFWYRVGLFQAIVNVMVATLSLFNSGWGVLLLVVAYIFSRRTPEGNFCMYHVATKDSATHDSVASDDPEKAESCRTAGSAAAMV